MRADVKFAYLRGKFGRLNQVVLELYIYKYH